MPRKSNSAIKLTSMPAAIGRLGAAADGIELSVVTIPVSSTCRLVSVTFVEARQSVKSLENLSKVVGGELHRAGKMSAAVLTQNKRAAHDHTSPSPKDSSAR